MKRTFVLPLDIRPMEAKAANDLPREQSIWQYEPKWDGFRCLAFKEGDAVELRAKSGKPLGRYFPEVVSILQALKPKRFVVDGEIVIETDGEVSFEALQMRLHPAESRIRKLALGTPAKFILFDMLANAAGKGLVDKPFVERRAALEAFVKSADHPDLTLSRRTTDIAVALAWLKKIRSWLY
jgi:ATP-dependent DNA ligase